MRPAAVDVSKLSDKLTNATWYLLNSSTRFARSRTDRVARSSLHTTSVETLPDHTSASTRSNPGRRSVAALAPASDYHLVQDDAS